MTVFFGGKHNRCLGENETFVLPLDAIRLFIYVCNRTKLSWKSGGINDVRYRYPVLMKDRRVY